MSIVRSSAFDYSLTRPSWAPDGSRFAVELDWKSYVVDKDGANATRLGPTDVHVTSPQFSPDGDHIAYSAYDVPEGDPYPRWRLFVADADGQNAAPITRDSGWHMQWSPDSKKILYVNAADEGGFYQCSINPDGTERKQVSLGHFEIHNDWSPDGKKLVYDSMYQNIRIYLANADGSQMQLVTPFGGYDDDLDPQFSPDGQTLLFEHRYHDGSGADLAVVPVDGSLDPKLITRDLGTAEDACWSPDGRQIAFSCDKEGSNDIWVMNADGTDLRRVTTDNSQHEFLPSWSPDGTTLAYMTRNAEHRDGYGVVAAPPPSVPKA